MKLLLDECVTRYLKPDFVGHEVNTAREAGFTGLKNGELLKAAEGEFDIMMDDEEGMDSQQEPPENSDPHNAQSNKTISKIQTLLKDVAAKQERAEKLLDMPGDGPGGDG